MKYYKIFRML